MSGGYLDVEHDNAGGGRDCEVEERAALGFPPGQIPNGFREIAPAGERQAKLAIAQAFLTAQRGTAQGRELLLPQRLFDGGQSAGSWDLDGHGISLAGQARRGVEYNATTVSAYPGTGCKPACTAPSASHPFRTDDA